MASRSEPSSVLREFGNGNQIVLPCVGLDPDTDPCPFCGADIFDPCAVEWGGDGAWRVSPDDSTQVQRWQGGAWVSDCWTGTPEQAAKWVADNIREMRANG